MALAELPAGAVVPAPILWVLLYVYGFIAFCSVVCYVHPRLRRPEARSARRVTSSVMKMAASTAVLLL